MLSISHSVNLASENTASEPEDWPVELDVIFLLHVLTEPDPRKPDLNNVASKMGKAYNRPKLAIRLDRLNRAAYFSAKKEVAEARAIDYNPPNKTSPGSRPQQGASQRISESNGSNQSQNTQKKRRTANRGRNSRRNLPIQSNNHRNSNPSDRSSARNNETTARNRQDTVPDVGRFNPLLSERMIPRSQPALSGGSANAVPMTSDQQRVSTVSSSSDHSRSNSRITPPSSPLSSMSSFSSSTEPSLIHKCKSASKHRPIRIRQSTDDTIRAEQPGEIKGKEPCRPVEVNRYADGDPGPSNSANRKRNKSRTGKNDNDNERDECDNQDNNGGRGNDDEKKKRKRSDSTKSKPSKGGEKCKTCKLCQRSCVCDHVSVLTTPKA